MKCTTVLFVLEAVCLAEAIAFCFFINATYSLTRCNCQNECTVVNVVCMWRYYDQRTLFIPPLMLIYYTHTNRLTGTSLCQTATERVDRQRIVSSRGFVQILRGDIYVCLLKSRCH